MVLAARNIVKAWLLVLALAGLFALLGWLIDGVRGLSLFVFCANPVASTPNGSRISASPRLCTAPIGPCCASGKSWDFRRSTSLT